MEILVILTVLGVVGAITFPKFVTALHRSREGRTKANLAKIRGAIAIYYSDNFGLYPSDEGTPETRLSQALVPDLLEKMPFVDLKHYYPNKLNTVNNRIDDGGDWYYTAYEGFVTVNSTRFDTVGRAISSW